LEYVVIFERGKKSYGAYVPDLPGCIAVGETGAPPDGAGPVRVYDDLNRLTTAGNEPWPSPRSPPLATGRSSTSTSGSTDT
jgi:hypothetical protein